MTFEQFIQINNGKKIDFDGSFGAQCVDLYRFYLQDVLQVPQTPGVIGAYQIFDTAPATFEKIKNTPTGLPQKGDIVVWSQKYGLYGHVGIFIAGGLIRFKAFVQNDPLGTPCQIKEYSYTGVIGWLRVKKNKEFKIVDNEGKMIAKVEFLDTLNIP